VTIERLTGNKAEISNGALDERYSLLSVDQIEWLQVIDAIQDQGLQFKFSFIFMTFLLENVAWTCINAWT
jgi:hypothetical protein